MILTKHQLEPLLNELDYDYKTSIGFWFRRYHDIDFCVRLDDTYVLNFNTTKEELMFKLKYSDCIYKAPL